MSDLATPVRCSPANPAAARRRRARGQRFRVAGDLRRRACTCSSWTISRYPFKVNPHFKLWAPLLDAPEMLDRLSAGQAAAAGVPAADRLLAQAAGDADRLLDARISRSKSFASGERGAQHLSRAASLRVHRRMAAGVRGLGLRCAQPGSAAHRLALPARGQDRLRARVHAPGVDARGAGPSRRRSVRSGPGARSTKSTSTICAPRATPKTSCPTPNIVALNENAAVLHYQHPGAPRCPRSGVRS